MRCSDVEVFQLNIDTDGIVTIGASAIESVFVNVLYFNGFLNAKFIRSEVLLTEGERGHTILQTYKGLFQVAAILILLRSILDAKVHATESGQIIAQIVRDVVFQFQVVELTLGALVNAGCLTELNLEITIQLVSNPVVLVNSRRIGRASCRERV